MVPQHQWPRDAHELAPVRGEAGHPSWGAGSQAGQPGAQAPVVLCLQEWNPDLTHTITRKEKQKKGEGVTLTNAGSTGETGAPAGERGR